MMSAMMKTISGIVLALLVVGCGGSSDDGGPSESSSPAKEALPTVSAATTCGALLDGSEPPMPGVIDLMNKSTTEPRDADAARAFADELEPIGTQADADLAPHVEVVVDQLRVFADSVDERRSFETDSLVTSLTEINNVCGNTPRF